MTTALVDTNLLVYVHDARDRAKQARAADVLGAGLQRGTLLLPHQAIVEFVAATTRRQADGGSILSPVDAWREAEEYLSIFPVLYPDEVTVRWAIHIAGGLGLAWWDAHLLAYAYQHEIEQVWSEDFEDGRHYGKVRAVNPLRDTGAPPPPRGARPTPGPLTEGPPSA